MSLEIHELVACPSCASSTFEVVKLGDHELRKCGVCSLVFAPAYGDPEAIYVDGYIEGETAFGLDISNPVFQEYLRFVGLRRIDMIEKVTGGPGTLLDVGCGSGELAAAAKERGWDVIGVEPVQQSVDVARARGLDVRCAMLEDAGLPERHYDVVSGFHVLEHMTEGTSFLRMLSRWVRPGGHVCIEVPNWRSYARRNSGEQWMHLRPLEHLAHYEPRTLRATFERAGLEPTVVRTATFLWSQQTLTFALADLGQLRWERRLGRFCRDGEHKGVPSKRPTAPVWAFLHATRRAYDAAKVGQVVFAMGRVPAASG